LLSSSAPDQISFYDVLLNTLRTDIDISIKMCTSQTII